jgi:hypothetical protein
MVFHRQRGSCRCTSYGLSRPSILGFLSIILPPSSFAQLTTSFPPNFDPSLTISTSNLPPPTSTPSAGAPQTQSNFPAVGTPAAGDDSHEQASRSFDYYFLILAFALVLVTGCVLYLGRRKRRKTALMQSHGRRALARDVEGWRSRLGVGRPSASSHTIGRAAREDGLDDRGEAPPPYVPRSKSPSIRSQELRRPTTSLSHAQGEVIELAGVHGDANPPGYHEHMNCWSGRNSVEITRPDMAVTASERVGSMV